MEREEAHPARSVDSVLVWMVAVLGDLVWDIMDGDDAIKEGDEHEDEETKGKVVQKRFKSKLRVMRKRRPMRTRQPARAAATTHLLSQNLVLLNWRM